MRPRTILNTRHLDLTVTRLCHQLIENHNDFSDTVIIGLQPRGVRLARIIHKRLAAITGNDSILYGELDVSFYRDDFRRRTSPIQIESTRLNFEIEDKNVVLIDDVLFTGRTVRAAMDAIMDFGRPAHIEFLVLIDRRYTRQVPICADYVGRIVDAVSSERVDVIWKGDDAKVVLKKLE